MGPYFNASMNLQKCFYGNEFAISALNFHHGEELLECFDIEASVYNIESVLR